MKKTEQINSAVFSKLLLFHNAGNKGKYVPLKTFNF